MNCYMNEVCVGENYYYDFLEILIICEGNVIYDIEGEWVKLGKGDMLIFNFGVNYYDIIELGMMNV